MRDSEEMDRLAASKAVPPPLVVVVDDDPAFCEAITHLLATVGYETNCYGSAAELISGGLIDRRGCMLLDVRLPGMSGLDLHAELTAAGNELPVIFLTGYGDIPMTVRAMRAGAVDFLVKPCRDQDLIDSVDRAIARGDARKSQRKPDPNALEKISSLTPREHQVFEQVAAGKLNKQIAGALGITETTVKLHRGNLMRKLGVRSIAALVRLYDVMNGDEAKPSA
jgi:FixJ family two-component response regulator